MVITPQRLKIPYVTREILRHTEEYCSRCGKPGIGEKKRCPKCQKYYREYQREYYWKNVEKIKKLRQERYWRDRDRPFPVRPLTALERVEKNRKYHQEYYRKHLQEKFKEYYSSHKTEMKLRNKKLAEIKKARLTPCYIRSCYLLPAGVSKDLIDAYRQLWKLRHLIKKKGTVKNATNTTS